MATLKSDRTTGIASQKPEAASAPIRFSGLQSKLIVPYVLLTLVMAGIGIYVITRLVTGTFRERFVNQISEAARAASYAVARQEKSNLENLYLCGYTIGVQEAVEAGDGRTLEELLLPVVLINHIEVLSVLDKNGIEIITLGQSPDTGEYLRTRGTDFSPYELVQNTLSGVSDQIGDKYVGLLDTNFGPALFTGMPFYGEQGQVVGAMLVGKRIATLKVDISDQALAEIILLDVERNLIDTSLAEPEGGYSSLEEQIRSFPEITPGQTYDLTLYESPYQIMFADFKPRDEHLGWLGVVLPSSYVVAAESTSRNTFVLIFTLGTVAIIIAGYVISQSIALPILRLRSLTQAVATGDLNQRIGLNRSDEIGELADAFDVMTLRLRDRTAEAARLYAEAIQRNKELADTNERLQSTQRQLIQSEKLAAIGQLTAGIVHDVKNPLAVIKGVSEFMLTEDELTAETRQEINLIHESAVKANNIVSDLLKFSRQSKPEMELHDLCTTVDAAIRLTAYPIRKAHVEVIKDIPETALMMEFDVQQIEQVLVNLITNAVHAMSDNGGTLRVTLTQSAGVAAIAVQDTGTGIAPDNLNRIFDPFFTTKPEGEGTGLGLSVSYGIISNHSGSIQVDSEVGKGTTFTILLPIQTGQNTIQSEMGETTHV